MTEYSALLTLAQALGSASVPTLALLALVGNHLGWWVTGREHRAMLAMKDAEIAALQTREREWREIALPATRGLTNALDLAESKRRRGGAS